VYIRAARPGPAQARKGPTRLISGRPGPVLNSGRAVPAHGPTPRPTARISLNVSCFKRAARNKKWLEIHIWARNTQGRRAERPEAGRGSGRAWLQGRRAQRRRGGRARAGEAAAPVGASALALAQGRPWLL
jgi:hypothetical protein